MIRSNRRPLMWIIPAAFCVLTWFGLEAVKALAGRQAAWAAGGVLLFVLVVALYGRSKRKG